MTNLGLFFWQICQKHLPNREKGVQENPQAFLYPENKTIFSALHPYPLRGAGDGGKQQFPRRGLLFFFTFRSGSVILKLYLQKGMMRADAPVFTQASTLYSSALAVLPARCRCGRPAALRRQLRGAVPQQSGASGCSHHSLLQRPVLFASGYRIRCRACPCQPDHEPFGLYHMGQLHRLRCTGQCRPRSKSCCGLLQTLKAISSVLIDWDIQCAL